MTVLMRERLSVLSARLQTLQRTQAALCAWQQLRQEIADAMTEVQRCARTYETYRGARRAELIADAYWVNGELTRLAVEVETVIEDLEHGGN